MCCKTVSSALPSFENKSLQINIKKGKKKKRLLKKRKKDFKKLPKLTKTFFFFLSPPCSLESRTFWTWNNNRRVFFSPSSITPSNNLTDKHISLPKALHMAQSTYIIFQLQILPIQTQKNSKATSFSSTLLILFTIEIHFLFIFFLIFLFSRDFACWAFPMLSL